MALQVIGAGFGRTGTMSLKFALETLGFKKTHHMMEIGPSRRQRAYWHRIAQGDTPDWDTVFEGFAASTDFPSCIFYRELAAHYPEAKVVLTVRDEDNWYRSVSETILPISTAAPRWLLALVPPLGKSFRMANELVWNRKFSGRAHEPAFAKQVFRDHIAEVQRVIPAERLLVYQVKEGWQPLCAFLGVPVPETPFPNVNDAASFKRALRVLRATHWAPLALAIGALLGWWAFG